MESQSKVFDKTKIGFRASKSIKKMYESIFIPRTSEKLKKSPFCKKT